MRTAIAALVICAAVSSVSASYDQEYWDSVPAGNNDWTYWDEDYNGLSLEPTDHNKPMNYFAGGGVGGSGYVSGPLGDMEPALVHSVSTYWPAYPGELFPASPFPYVDLSIANAAISVYIRGGHSPTSPPVDLAGGEVRFFIGYYDGKGTATSDDDEQAFFCTKDSFDVGNNVWDQTIVTLGGDTNWDIIEQDEDGVLTQPTDLYDGPQQWGFCIHGVPLGDSPGGGTLGFDRFKVTPEPGALAILLIGSMVLRRKRKS
jgi:hypothetical protein